MYLSKVTVVDPQAWHRRRRKMPNDLFREHQMIWDLFDNTPTQKRDFLYRREDQPGKLPIYYVLSRRQPHCEDEDLELQSKAFNPVLRMGDRLRFSLRANAVITRKVDEQSKKRVRRDIIEAKVDAYKERFPNPADRPSPSIVHHEATLGWLGKQAESHGFSVEEFFVENHTFHKLRKPGDSNTRRFTSLDLHGRLMVTAPDQFLDAMKTGFGRSKAFGCGLLLVKRLADG